MRCWITFFLPVFVVSPLFAAEVGFNQYVSSSDNDLVNNFNFLSSSPYVQFSTGGITGGYVDVPSSGASDAIYKTAAFENSAGAELSVSLSFKLGPNPNPEQNKVVLELRVVPNVTQGTGFADHVSVAVLASSGSNLVGWSNSRVGSNNSAVEGTPFTGVVGNWYRLTMGFINLGDDNVRVSGLIEELGTNGMANPSARLSWSRDYTNPTISNDTSVYAGFLGQGTVGADRLDNFAVIPEPGSSLLLLFGGVLLWSRRNIGRGSVSPRTKSCRCHASRA